MKLGQKVKCYGYLRKKKLPYVIANQEDEHIEDENEIKLCFGEEIKLDVYEIVEKEFEGIYVGNTTRATSRNYVSDTDGDKSYISTYISEYSQIAKVYYGNCKSRLVPMSLMISQTTIYDFIGDKIC